jgi:peroxygenase
MAAKTTTEDTGEGNEALQTVAPKAPVTYERPIHTHGLGIPKPHVPRALKAVDADHPNGTAGHKADGYSVLQQHVAFFDRNHDGIIYPWETFEGFRAIGFGYIISFLGMVIINGAFSYATLDSWIPSPLFPIYIRNVHKAKHGSDSEVYDTEGRFVPEKFEELFSKFARHDKSKLYFGELYELTSANRNAVDPFGWTAEKLEWGIFYLLLKDQGGFVTKEQVRGMFDGSLFEAISKQREQSMLHKKKV